MAYKHTHSIQVPPSRRRAVPETDEEERMPVSRLPFPCPLPCPPWPPSRGSVIGPFPSQLPIRASSLGASLVNEKKKKDITRRASILILILASSRNSDSIVVVVALKKYEAAAQDVI